MGGRVRFLRGGHLKNKLNKYMTKLTHKEGWIQINEKVKVKVNSSKLYRYKGDKGWVLMPLKKHK